MTLGSLRSYGRDWQRKLGLPHWEIVFRWMTEKEEKQVPTFNGFCTWTPEHTYATVAVSRKSEDIKHTIIHELLHIRLQGSDQQPVAISVPTEITINALTGALLKI